MIKTAIIGASGYIGSHLLNCYRKTFLDCVGTTFSKSRSDLITFDLSHHDVNNLRLQETGHQAVLIASARTNVVWCESNPTESYEFNVRSTLKLIEQLGKTTLTVIYLSSDYVFDGLSGNYSDTAEVNPTTQYGRQKAAVEQEIPNLTQNYLILRLSKIYGTQWKDGTLLDSLASLLCQGQMIETATDKIFNPTNINDLATMLFFIQQQSVQGLFNLCNPHSYSRHQIALQLTEALGVCSTLVKPVRLGANRALKHIPLNTSLKSSSLFETCHSSLLSMDKAVKLVASNWESQKFLA